MRETVGLLVIALLCIGLFLQYSRPVKTVATEEFVDTYHRDIEEFAELASNYVRAFHENGSWPKPGSYPTKHLRYKGTEAKSLTFPDRRRDFYETTHDGGRELDVKLWADGRFEVVVTNDPCG